MSESNSFSNDSFKLIISVNNVTSGTNIDELSPDQPHELLEIGDQTLVLELPKNSCSQGHQVFLKVRMLGNPQVNPQTDLLVGTGKVDFIEKVSSTKIRVGIHLSQFEEKDWENLIEIYSKRQEELAEFLKNAKG